MTARMTDRECSAAATEQNQSVEGSFAEGPAMTKLKAVMASPAAAKAPSAPSGPAAPTSPGPTSQGPTSQGPTISGFQKKKVLCDFVCLDLFVICVSFLGCFIYLFV